MATVKNKRLIGYDSKGTDGSDFSKMDVIYSCKIMDSESDVIYYPAVSIAANTSEAGIDAALIAAANPF